MRWVLNSKHFYKESCLACLSTDLDLNPPATIKIKITIKLHWYLIIIKWICQCLLLIRISLHLIIRAWLFIPKASEVCSFGQTSLTLVYQWQTHPLPAQLSNSLLLCFQNNFILLFSLKGLYVCNQHLFIDEINLNVA